MKKKEILEKIKSSIDHNDKAVIHALGVIFSRQTSEEIQAQDAIFRNNQGFSGNDAEILTSFYLQYKSRNFLSQKQIELARRKIRRYSNQLLENAIQNGKIQRLGRSNYQIARTEIGV